MKKTEWMSGREVIELLEIRKFDLVDYIKRGLIEPFDGLGRPFPIAPVKTIFDLPVQEDEARRKINQMMDWLFKREEVLRLQEEIEVAESLEGVCISRREADRRHRLAEAIACQTTNPARYISIFEVAPFSILNAYIKANEIEGASDKADDSNRYISPFKGSLSNILNAFIKANEIEGVGDKADDSNRYISPFKDLPSSILRANSEGSPSNILEKAFGGSPPSILREAFKDSPFSILIPHIKAEKEANEIEGVGDKADDSEIQNEASEIVGQDVKNVESPEKVEHPACLFACDIWTKYPWILQKHVARLYLWKHKEDSVCPKTIARYISGAHPEPEKKVKVRRDNNKKEAYYSKLYSALENYTYAGVHYKFDSIEDMKSEIINKR